MSMVLTGGAGFIGSVLCDRLLMQGEDVICVDDFNDYYSPGRKRRNIAGALENNAFTLCEADVRDYAAMEKVFAENNVEKVVHLAARAGVRPSIANPRLYGEVNVGGTLNMLELARRHGVESFVFASSSSVYGNCSDTPFSESMATDTPVSPYAATKKAGEGLCHACHHLHGMDIACLRLFTVYGPRGRPDMAPYIFTDRVYRGEAIKKFGDGSSQRDYTYVGDIVDGVIRAMGLKGFEVINLGNSRPVALDDFIAVVEETVGKKAVVEELPMQPGDVDVTCADVSKAKRVLGWEPTTNIRDGMHKFFEWYKEEVVQ
ncbi:MAG: GDP-mannose 4,6-dehydratase [Candidatus Diapherotrites archaeon]|nr:GDP-mannose 4,6-dehydratase [Candidatus Diapherotrites archaeon]